jgi:catechol 2,3-dioxygenase-like lactoylglutathione lyase family enzyme
MAATSVRFLYSGIRVRDLAQSIKFYRALGFRVYQRGRMEHGGEWVHMVFPGSRHHLELNFYPKGNRYYEPRRKGTEFDHFGFFARDVDGWLRLALRAGAKRVADFTEGKNRLVYVNDPNGVCLEAFGPARPRRRAHRT